MIEYLINFESLPWHSSVPGMRSKFYTNDDVKLRLVEFSEEFVETEWCQKGHIGYVLEGEMVLDICGELKHFKTGNGIFIPEGKSHKHKETVKTTKLILVERA